VIRTHTYAVLEVSPAAYEEIRSLLEAAGYGHVRVNRGGQVLLDMHGIALAPDSSTRGGGVEPPGGGPPGGP